MITFCQAVLNTRNFVFEAYGGTDDEARDALIATLKVHAMQYQLEPDWWEDYATDICYRKITLGAGYRDREIL